MDATNNVDFSISKNIRRGIPLYNISIYANGMKQSLRMLITKDNAVCAHKDGEPSANGFTESKYISLEDGVDILERYFGDLIKSMREDIQKVKSVSHGN